jgi:hypothetical protein
MKAEQRKELETNTLADKMGHMMQRVKAGQRRTFFIYFLVAASVAVAAFLGYRWWTTERQERSEQWVRFYDGSGQQIQEFAANKEIGETNVGKAARLQLAWHLYWTDGIKMVGAEPRLAMVRLMQAKQIYQTVAEQSKDDPLYEPQSLLGAAVCEESLAAQDPRTHLEEAKKLYKGLAEHEKYGKMAEGRFAEERLKILNEKTRYEALVDEYLELKTMLDIPAEERRPLAPGKGKGLIQDVP